MSLVLLTGCGGQGEDDGEFSEAPSGVTNDNALSPNALSPNALSPNALSPNALSLNALSPNALGPSALAAILDPGTAGDLSRQFLRYAVGCALKPSQSFSFTWTDVAGVAHHETYSGILGLAPAWASRGLAADAQRWVSACLAARTNWYGVQVIISSRGSSSALNPVDSVEMSTYPMREGAFWGNLFTGSPALYACHEPANDAHSRSLLRDCAAGHLDASGAIQDCGMIHIVGACADHCAAPASAGYFPSCASNPASTATSTSQVITTFLP